MNELTLNTVTISLADIERKNAEIAQLKANQDIIKSSEAILKEQIRRLSNELAENTKTVKITDRYDNFIGTMNMVDVEQKLLMQTETRFKDRIEDLQSDIKSRKTEIEELEAKIKELKSEKKDIEIQYNKQLQAVRDENALINRANTLAVETEKVKLSEEHIAKLQTYKETLKEFETRLTETQLELSKERENKTDRELAAGIYKDIATLREELEYLRAAKPFWTKVYALLLKVRRVNFWTIGNNVNRLYKS